MLYRTFKLALREPELLRGRTVLAGARSGGIRRAAAENLTKLKTTPDRSINTLGAPVVSVIEKSAANLGRPWPALGPHLHKRV